MNRLLEALRREKIASLVGLGIILSVVATFTYVRYQQYRLNKAMVAVTAAAKNLEPDLIKWAQSVLKKDAIVWQKMVDSKNVPVPSHYGSVKSDSIPQWIRDFMEPGSLRYASVDRREANTEIHLQYPSGVFVTVVLPSDYSNGYIKAWRGIR